MKKETRIKLTQLVLRTTLRRCENITKDFFLDELGIEEEEVKSVIDELLDEHVLKVKYTFACPHCGELVTVRSAKEKEMDCPYCELHLDLQRLIDGATIRYIIRREEYMEYMEEKYSKELEEAKRGKVENSNLIAFKAQTYEEGDNMSEIEPYLFISHAHVDKKYVKPFVNFLISMGIPREKIFCSSVEGHKLPWGDNVYDALAYKFRSEQTNLIVIFMLSDNFYASKACLNEMGATWVLKKEYRSVLLPGFKYSAIEGAIDPYKVGISYDSESFRIDLNDIKIQFSEIFSLNQLSDSAWDSIRDDFVEKIENIKKES